MTLDRVKLAKALALTSSPMDGEALASVRAANRLVTAAGMTWQDVLLSDALWPAGSPRDATPDAPVDMPDGTALRPPYGVRWIDTILWLLGQLRGFSTEESLEHARWLGALPHKMTRRKITPREAKLLMGIYHSYVPVPAPWAPR